MFRSNPIIDRFIDFVSLLPKYYIDLIKVKEINKSPLRIAYDLLELFFNYKTFPEHYGPCRLWEVDKCNWKYYYGSSYQAYQRIKLQREVEPREYVILFQDKVICERLCRDIGANIPYTYGIITPNENYKDKIRSWINNSGVDTFFIKPLYGRSGRGTILLKRVNKNLFIQNGNRNVPLSDYDLKEKAIVQEYLIQDSRMSKLSVSSFNTVRVATMYTKKDSIIVVAATMRCGVGESYIDNWFAGGVAIGIDLETGKLRKYGYDKKGNRYIEHPTSKVVFEGFIVPECQKMIDIALKIQEAFPCYRILGMDIGLLENGEPVVVEINGSLDILFLEQTNGPLLQKEYVLNAFGDYDLFVNKHQRKLYNNFKSIELR